MVSSVSPQSDHSNAVSTSSSNIKEMQLQDMLLMLPKVHRGCLHGILTPSTQDCTSHASASHAANDPPFATWQPPNRYEKCRRIFDFLRGNAEGAAGEVEASLKPATRAQTGGQDQGPPSPGASRWAGAAVSGRNEGKGRSSPLPKRNQGARRT